DAVEFLGQLDEGAVAARGDVGDDRAHRLLDVFGYLALGGEKITEAGGEIGGAAVEADGHGMVLAHVPEKWELPPSMAPAVPGKGRNPAFSVHSRESGNPGGRMLQAVR